MKIVRMDENNAHLLNTLDARHLVSEVAALRLARGGFSLEYKPLASSVWRRAAENEQITAEGFLGRRDRDVFFGYLDGALCGQMVLAQNWNQMALVLDVRVDIPARRKGLGRELMDVAMDWAGLHGMEGVMVETQDANPAACQFLEHCGFTLAGVDCMLYAGLARKSEKASPLLDSGLFYYKMIRPEGK